MNLARNTTIASFVWAILFSFLSVAVCESVAVGDLLDAPTITEPIIDSAKFSSKVRSKLNQLRKKYPDVRRGAEGAADAQKLAEEAFRRGGGRVGPPVGQGADSALYFDDGPVTWVFRPDGTFWSMRINSGWTP